MSLPSFQLAVAQIDPRLGDEEYNVRKHVEMIQRAKDGGAKLVVFPELSLSGYGIKDLHWDLALRAETSPRLQPLLAASKGIIVICGGVEEAPGFGIFNSAFCFEDGTVRSVHRKIYPPTYGMFEELRYFSPGRSVEAFDSGVGRLGVLICEDFWHLSLPYLLALDGAEILIGIAASPTRLSPEEHELGIEMINSEHHRSFARLLSTYVVFCNRVGYEDGVNFWGGSEVIDPAGNIVAQAKPFEEELIFATVELNNIRRARRLSRHFHDEDPSLVARELRRLLRDRRLR